MLPFQKCKVVWKIFIAEISACYTIKEVTLCIMWEEQKLANDIMSYLGTFFINVYFLHLYIEKLT